MPNTTNPIAPGSPGFFPAFDGNDQLTVSQLLNPITEIPAVIYSLVENNQGYFLNDLFARGPRVTGGAVAYTEDNPQDLFLDADRTFAPRAPGADAKRIGASHGDRKMQAVESWSGYFNVSDEVVDRNRTDEVRDILTRAANTYADVFQTRGLSLANAFLNAKSRTVAAGTAWTTAFSSGIANVNPATLPAASLSLAVMQFTKDKAGIVPDFVVLHPDDMVTLDTVYGDKTEQVLGRYGLTPKTSPLQTKGTALIGKRGALGYILPEKEMDVEPERKARSKSTDYVLDSREAMVAKNSGAALLLTGISS